MDLGFRLDTTLEIYEISGFRYHTYYLEDWFDRFGLGK